MSVSINHL